MSSAGQPLAYSLQHPITADAAHWFALHTFPRHEKRVAAELMNAGVETYLPLVTKLNQWSDRRKQVDLPLFSCYSFVRIVPSLDMRAKVLRTGGVIGFVGAYKQGTPIPESQIEDVRTLLINKVQLDPYPFLREGQRVRIRGGSLNGLEGLLVRKDGTRRLVISIASLERSMSMCVEGLDVEAII